MIDRVIFFLMEFIRYPGYLWANDQTIVSVVSA